MFDAADPTSSVHSLMDAGFMRHRTSPSRASSRPPEQPAEKPVRDIARFNARRQTYDRRTLPKLLPCAPKGGRLLCSLEAKFGVSHGFSWRPVIRSSDGLTVEFGHNSAGFAMLTSSLSKALGELAPEGTLVTVELDSQQNALLFEIKVSPDGSVEKVRQLYTFRSVAAIDVVCTNKPTFNGCNVEFVDLFHQDRDIFDSPNVHTS